MNRFGELLREFRLRSNDPNNIRRQLSQEKLGRLLGTELTDGGGYTGAAVSDWELGKSKIHADQRYVLAGLIKVLYKRGGIKTVREANQLLEAGNYRALDSAEGQEIFPLIFAEEIASPIPQKAKADSSMIWRALESLFVSSGGLQALRDAAEEGTLPTWPRVLAGLLRRELDHWSTAVTVRTILWPWIWLFTWILIAPSLRWPFANGETASLAIRLYIAATLAIPLIIGLLTDTKGNLFWQQHDLADSVIIRLYVYQGAGIGFNLGYFAILAVSLASYYLHLGLPLWVELTLTIVPLIVGNMAARLVPYNLWLAYGRLSLSDGWIFFVVALLGPAWGFFFMQFYSIILTPAPGIFVVLVAITIFIMIQARQNKPRS